MRKLLIHTVFIDFCQKFINTSISKLKFIFLYYRFSKISNWDKKKYQQVANFDTVFVPI